MTEQSAGAVYAAHLEVDYPEQHDRVTTLFRLFLIIPIAIVMAVLLPAPPRRSTTGAVRWCANRAVASPPACSSRPC